VIDGGPAGAGETQLDPTARRRVAQRVADEVIEDWSVEGLDLEARVPGVGLPWEREVIDEAGEPRGLLVEDVPGVWPGRDDVGLHALDVPADRGDRTLTRSRSARRADARLDEDERRDPEQHTATSLPRFAAAWRACA
jgi:hypothetical protein